MTDPAFLESCGLALFGDGWATAMAGALDVPDARIAAWRAGEVAIPPVVWHELAAIARDRSAEIEALAGDLSVRAGR